MHELQKKLLRLAQEENLGRYTLRALGAMVGEKSPQKIKHHLGQLEKRGLIRVDRGNSLIEKAQQGGITSLLRGAQLLSIPILGAANAGPANRLAEAHIEGYLRISSTVLGSSSKRKLFALKVDGPSMNRAEVDGKRIENGDYVIINSEVRSPRDGDVVLSIIDGMANIKRYHRDTANKQVVLVSDSTDQFPPIYIHEDDDFMINGKVVQVVKKPLSKRNLA
jgi:SOS-response transcriptional repressor LexA